MPVHFDTSSPTTPVKGRIIAMDATSPALTHTVSTTPAPIPFKVNSRVCIHSMTTAPQYNHQSGTVLQNFDNGRAGVVLDSDKDSILVFKPTKLRLIQQIAVDSFQPKVCNSADLPEAPSTPPLRLQNPVPSTSSLSCATITLAFYCDKVVSICDFTYTAGWLDKRVESTRTHSIRQLVVSTDGHHHCKRLIF